MEGLFELVSQLAQLRGDIVDVLLRELLRHVQREVGRGGMGGEGAEAHLIGVAGQGSVGDEGRGGQHAGGLHA